MCSFQAEDVLLSTITSGVGPAERWASVQVLVCARVVTAPVISELLHHLHDSQQHQSGRRERAADLLARSSAITVRNVYWNVLFQTQEKLKFFTLMHTMIPRIA